MDFWQHFIAIFVSLFVITDPFGNVGIFLSITDGGDEAFRRKMAFKGSLYSFLLMFVFFAGGTYIMSFFGITIDGIRIGGGLIVSRIGFGLLTPKEDRSVDADGPGSSPKQDISFCPLALPLIAGPGALAVVLAASAKIETFAWSPYLSITMAILATSLFTWLCLRFSVRLLHLMGVTGMNAVTRIMGFLLICIAIQMIITGTENLMYQWGFIETSVHEKISTMTKHFAF